MLLRGLDSNQRPSGNEPAKLPLLHPASAYNSAGRVGWFVFLCGFLHHLQFSAQSLAQYPAHVDLDRVADIFFLLGLGPN